MSDTATKTVKYVKPSAAAAPQWFPAEHQDDFAVVILPREFNRNGVGGKSEALCSILTFTEEDFQAGKPTHIYSDAVVSAGVIFKQLVRVYESGSPLIGYVSQGSETTFGTKPWIIKDLDDDTEAAIIRLWEGIMA